MTERNILSKKIILAEAVKQGQAVSWSGHLATTGSGDKEPAGIARSNGVMGEIIAVMTVGLVSVPHTGLSLGDGVKANAGAIEKAANANEAFAEVSERTSDKLAEIQIK